MTDQSHVHYENELDSETGATLRRWLAKSPTSSEVSDALARFRRQRTAASSRKFGGRAASLRRLCVATAASFAFGLMWVGSQTELWGQVVVDFEASRTPENNAESGVPASVFPSGMRFLLLMHVGSLLIGLLTIFLVGVLTQIRVFPLATDSAVRRVAILWQDRCLKCAIGSYVVGIGLGGIWAHLCWGSPWRWDPRESFALLTLGLMVLWWGLSWSPKSIAESVLEDCRVAAFGTMAFWLIALCVVLGPLYASEVRSYGTTGMTTLIAAVGFANLTGILVIAGWRLTSHQRKGRDPLVGTR